MTGLINSLDNISDKQPYQSYQAMVGITTFEVLVPLQRAQEFEHQVASLPDKEASLLQLVETLSGKVRKI
jgi:hypothetical protein